MLITDFNKSSISWLGASKGIFRLISVLTYYDKLNNKISYGLSESVLAGNVYGQDNLIKVPYYMFQVYGNSSKQKILRTDLAINTFRNKNIFIKRKKINDTNFNKIFDKFKLIIKKRKNDRILSFKDIYQNFENNNFTSKVKFTNFNNLSFEIQFPVNHINVSKLKKKWQIETGPVLLPLITKNTIFDFLPCFIIFNSFTSMDIFYDYPFGLRNKKKSHIKNVNCEIELYTNNI
mgnify:CR=1 FL=1|tara:strand:+ start:1257 stop:1958 length:702 start_codon:yes stop_codon:yes gene_type:complete